MSSGIVCKVWNIKGNTGKKNTNAQLGDSISYILNDEKTEIKLEMPGSIFDEEAGQLGRECKYVENDIKTVNGAYIGTRNLVSDDIQEAVEEMMQVKKFFGKTGGRSALHGIISLPEFESDISNAERLMQLCSDVLKELFPNHQAIFAVHTNTDDLHVHFIVNSVGLDGKKIHQPEGFIKNVVQPCVNKKAMEYGFSPNEKWLKYHKNGVTRYVEIKMDLRSAIDQAIEKANSFDDFLSELRLSGITVNVGKHISLQMEGMDKAMRSYQLGNSYSKDAIVSRIQTRRNAFDKLHIGSYSIKKEDDDLVELKLSVLKKYKDMTQTEKKEVISQLKQGVNPWKVHAKTNWQLKNIVDDLNMSVRFRSYVSFYSSDGTVQGALDGILRIKEQIGKEKKELRDLGKKYKPIFDIYEEMKKLEKKSYLYEHEGNEEYREEFEKYRELTRRLKNGYGKDIREVAAFIEEYQGQFLYANAQLEELSNEYREIKKYCMENGIEQVKTDSILDLVGFAKAQKFAKQNIFTTDVSYLVSSHYPDVILRVVTNPTTDSKGRTVENTSITLLNHYGDEIEGCESKDGIPEFKKYVSKLEHEYGIKNCEKFQDVLKARDFAKACKDNSSLKTEKEFSNAMDPAAGDRSSVKEHKTYSFTQAINLKSAADSVGMFVIVNEENPQYMAVVTSGKESIAIQVVDKDNRKCQKITIPGIQRKNAEGYNAISALCQKYGFSDRMYAYANLEEAKKYINAQNRKTGIQK